MEKTLAIIKPDAVERRLTGKIVSKIEENGFSVIAMKMLSLTKREAEGFYKVHVEMPFFNSLTDYMSSGKIIVMVLGKDNAIAEWRGLMGVTNPQEAEPGTVRREFAIDIEKNSVHGSDSQKSAAYEISYFFKSLDLL